MVQAARRSHLLLGHSLSTVIGLSIVAAGGLAAVAPIPDMTEGTGILEAPVPGHPPENCPTQPDMLISRTDPF